MKFIYLALALCVSGCATAPARKPVIEGQSVAPVGALEACQRHERGLLCSH